MDVEGSRVVHRKRRARKLAVVVAVQNVLVVACLLVTLYVNYGAQKQKQPSEDNVHIQFQGISDCDSNETLAFHQVISSHKMSRVDNKIAIQCTGPYILYMTVCHVSMEKKELSGVLQVEVAGKKNPVTNFTLTTSDEDCRGLHSIVYFTAKEQASLHLYGHRHFKIKNATLSLSYLLGRQCHD